MLWIKCLSFLAPMFYPQIATFCGSQLYINNLANVIKSSEFQKEDFFQMWIINVIYEAQQFHNLEICSGYPFLHTFTETDINSNKYWFEKHL